MASPQTIGASRNVGWVADPDGRGTSSLIVTCLVTLGLCVWSAMHLSIPRRNEKNWYHTLQYVKWSIIGVVGPELVLFAAWRQYVSAQALLGEVQATEARKATPNSTTVFVAVLFSET